MHSGIWIAVFACISIGIPTEGIAERGIIVGVNDAYANEYFLYSLRHLRENLACFLPVEIWFSGDELSEAMQEKLKEFGPVTFHDITQSLGGDPKEYRGWQIKGWLFSLTSFTEAVLMNADVYFYQNPEILFSHPAYGERGAFFFRDRQSRFNFYDNLFFFGDKNPEKNLCFYKKRRDFLRKFIPESGPFCPEEWKFYWNDTYPSSENRFPSEHVESGCVVLRKEGHERSIRYMAELNAQKDFVYRFVHGDKETFWMACEMAGEPYAVNPDPSYEMYNGEQATDGSIYQFLDGHLLYKQKSPRFITPRAYFLPDGKGPIYFPDSDLRKNMNELFVMRFR